MWRKTNRAGLQLEIVRVLPKDFDVHNVHQVRWALSLFSSYEILSRRKAKADLTMLELPQTSDWSTQVKSDFEAFVKSCRFTRTLKSNLSKREVPKDFFSIKGGPLGKGVTAATDDAKALLGAPELLTKLCTLLDHESSLALIERVNALAQFSNLDGKLPILKTIGIPDKGPKIRTITSGNYFLQWTLKPLHQQLMRLLRTIKEDGTYRQSRVALTIGQHSKVTTPWCYDMTSATDRFPIWIQELVLENLEEGLGPKWAALMANCQSYSPDHNKWFTFSVGQPMGIYSSWATFTLCHHYVVRYAFNLARRSPSGNYAIIGDDIVILDEDAAERYKELILNLGVTISEAKSVLPSKKVERFNFNSIEFASRYFRDGVEISPLRPNELLSMKGSSWPNLMNVLMNIKERWTEEEYDVFSNTSTPAEKQPFLLWVDKTHRKVASLVVQAPFDLASHLEVKREEVWPASDNLSLLTARFEIGYNKTCSLLNLLSRIQEANKRFGQDLTEAEHEILHRYHPFNRSLELLEDDILRMFRNFNSGSFSIVDVYELGVNLDLALALAEGKYKTVKDYKSLRSKRSQASATYILDVWKYLLNDLEWNSPSGCQIGKKLSSVGESFDPGDFW
jgi:hypothetical protein